MGEDQVLVEIVIFAMVAVFLVYRLRSVLGRRNGEERQRPNPFAPPPPPAGEEKHASNGDTVIPLPEKSDKEEIYQPGDQRPLAAWLEEINRADHPS